MLKRPKYLFFPKKCHCSQTDATSWFESNFMKINNEHIFCTTQFELKIQHLVLNRTQVKQVRYTSHLTVTLDLFAYQWGQTFEKTSTET